MSTSFNPRYKNKYSLRSYKVFLNTYDCMLSKIYYEEGIDQFYFDFYTTTTGHSTGQCIEECLDKSLDQLEHDNL